MFTFIKWSLLLSFIIFIWFCTSYFLNLSQQDIGHNKENAINAIEKSDISLFFKPLTQKMKQNAKEKIDIYIKKFLD